MVTIHKGEHLQKVLLQLERLRRHYETSVKTYDHPSLLDLSHILRIWTELKTVLPDISKDFEIKKPFKTASPVRKLMKGIRGCVYILSYLPKDGVTTYASNGILLDVPYKEGEPFSTGFMAKNVDGSVLLKQFCFVGKVLDQQHREAININKVKRCNYGNWLSSEIVRLQYLSTSGSLEKHSISREILIKRVANILDASHTSLVGGEDSNNKFDKPIKWLMQFGCGGLPLPYFLLLKIAQDILEYIPPLIPGEN